MIEASAERILGTLPADAVVLDVGGWARPFGRADYVLDLNPYETRGLLGGATHGPERFSAATWVQADICARQPWPFADGQFDFVTCSHTLEDVRDPVWVCSELVRVARAGYIETPSRLEEQCYGIQGPWVGWGHHHWIVEEVDGRLLFTFKHHVMHGRDSDHFPAGFHERLSEGEKVLAFFWDGEFQYEEQIFQHAEQLDSWLSHFVSDAMEDRGVAAAAPPPARRADRLRRRIGRMIG